MKFLRLSRVDAENKSAYKEISEGRNRRVFYIMSLFMAIVEVALIVFQYIRLGDRLFSLMYFYIYIVTALVFLLFFGLYHMYKKGIFKRRQTFFDCAILLCAFALTLITGAEELTHGAHDAVLFLALTILVSSVIYVEVKLWWIMLVAINIAYVAILYANMVDIEELTGSILNCVFILIANVIVSIPIHNARIYSFNQQMEIEKTNELLKRTNAILESSNKELEQSATTDGLTRILNRRAFDDALALGWEQCILSGKPLSVLIMDIDDFKAFNDCYGHVKGDECLVSVAQTIHGCLKRSGDSVYRYGGEEFVVLLAGVDAHGSKTVASRIFEAVDGLKIPHCTDRKIVTLSGGVHTVFPVSCDDMYYVLQKADYALYCAKKSGKHRFVVFGEIEN